ncbi:unannotated protein [freshwater metagenome]|uniref:Unannotated protein n=1 Tax=freshwater metagenome TaxID=449393 RepID=A0A6J5YDM0_9ZZZZ
MTEHVEHRFDRVMTGELLVGRPGRIEQAHRVIERSLNGIVFGAEPMVGEDLADGETTRHTERRGVRANQRVPEIKGDGLHRTGGHGRLNASG